MGKSSRVEVVGAKRLRFVRADLAFEAEHEGDEPYHAEEWLKDVWIGYGKAVGGSARPEAQSWLELVSLARNILAAELTQELAPEYYKPEWVNSEWENENNFQEDES